MSTDTPAHISEGDIAKEFDQAAQRIMAQGGFIAYSRRTGLPIGPVIDIRTYSGRRFVLVDIDQQMVFYTEVDAVFLRYLGQTQLK